MGCSHHPFQRRLSAHSYCNSFWKAASHSPHLLHCLCIQRSPSQRKKIAANQVALEAKKKLHKNRKASYWSVIVLLVILLCFIPTNVCSAILTSFKERIPPNIIVTDFVCFFFRFLPVLNSLFNPLIYAFRKIYFRVAFIQLWPRKTFCKLSLELEKKIL